MRNLIGYLKICLLVFSFALLLSSIPKQTQAKETFTVYSSLTHNLNENNINTSIILQITSKTPIVLSYYSTNIPVSNTKIECYNNKTQKKLECTANQRSSSTDLLISLENTIIKQDVPLEIRITYSLQTTKENTYNILSSIEDTQTEEVVITYPKAMGEPLWTSDPIQNIKIEGSNYKLIIKEPKLKNISLTFGKQISYSFKISKVFRNSLEDQTQTFEIIVPSDTHSQTILWNEVSPSPNIAERDIDGNYIFKYIVAPSSSIDCKVTGHIIKNNESVKTTDVRADLKIPTGNWEIENTSELKRIQTYLSNKLPSLSTTQKIDDLDSANKELLYKYIYQYVIERLSPEKELKTGIQENLRKGIPNLLETPNNASSIDYTDLLIAIYRAYGIPSRQILGYISNVSGYTSDGFYHYWVEIYDESTTSWVILDPFLEDYTTKSLYKSSFFDHINIITRGRSTVSPKLTFFNDSDFQLKSSSDESIEVKFLQESQLIFGKTMITDQYIKGTINVLNKGNIAISRIDILKSNILDIKRYLDPVNNLNSRIILPKESSIIQLNIPNNNIAGISFVNLKFVTEKYSTESLLESSSLKVETPLMLELLSFVLSFLGFSLFVYLVYFVGMKFRKTNQ